MGGPIGGGHEGHGQHGGGEPRESGGDQHPGPHRAVEHAAGQLRPYQDRGRLGEHRQAGSLGRQPDHLLEVERDQVERSEERGGAEEHGEVDSAECAVAQEPQAHQGLGRSQLDHDRRDEQAGHTR